MTPSPSAPPVLPRLRKIHVARPCDQSWDSMTGDERTRHCRRCKQSVHNLSAMTAAEVEAFVERVAGDACVRFYRRTDGTVMTADCNTRTDRARRRGFVLAGIAFAGAAALSAAYVHFDRSPERRRAYAVAGGMGAPDVPPTPSTRIAPPPPEMPVYGTEAMAGGMGEAPLPQPR